MTNAANDTPPAPHEIVVLPSGHVTISACALKLFNLIASTRRLFTRGGAVVQLVRRKRELPALEVLRPAAARSCFEKFAKLMAWRAGKDGEAVLKPTNCPVQMAEALLATAEAQALLPCITGLINAPIIRENEGNLEVAGPGYDPVTGLYITGGVRPPEVQLDVAISSLAGLLDEFDFQTPGDRSRATASLIAPGLKLGGLLKGGVPTDVAEANKSQAGKTYRQKLSAAIYGEKVVLVTNRSGGVGSVDESFDQKLIGGRPFIQFDNFRGRLASQHLEAFLTSEGSFGCRVPHRGEVNVEPERFFISLTSNGVDTTRDMANRSSIVRIRKREGYQYRKYPEGELLEHVRANQAFYLGCVFAVIREWHRQGKLKTDETRHDFQEWCQVLDWIVQKLFKAAPLMDGHREAQEHVSNPALVWLRAVAIAASGCASLDKPLIASQIVEICKGATISIPGMAAEANEDTAKLMVGSLLSRLFSDGDRLGVDRFTITRGQKEQERTDGDGGKYTLNVYTISVRASEPSPKPQGPTSSSGSQLSGASPDSGKADPADVSPMVEGSTPVSSQTAATATASSAGPVDVLQLQRLERAARASAVGAVGKVNS